MAEVKEVASDIASAANASVKLRVYRKESEFKGEGADKYWYSATRSDGCSVRCKFNCSIPEEFQELGAFEISNTVGNYKMKEVTKKGETYTNYTYYIKSCKFSEIPVENLPL